MRSSGEGGVAAVHLESVGDVADATRVKYTRELRVGHGQRKACEREVWAVRAIPGAVVWRPRVGNKFRRAGPDDDSLETNSARVGAGAADRFVDMGSRGPDCCCPK